MPDCWAKGCKSRNTDSRKNKAQKQWEQSHGRNITFHKIPKNIENREKWLKRMGLDNKSVPENAKLCSLHFDESAFDRRDDYYIRIRPNAIPFENESVNIEIPRKKQKLLKETIDQGNIDLKVTEEICDTKQETVQGNCHSDILATVQWYDGTAMVESTSSNYEAIDAIPQPSTPPRTVKHKATAVSPHLSENTPRKQTLRIALINTRKNYNKKIQLLQQKYRRSTKRIANFKRLLKNITEAFLLHQVLQRFIGNINVFQNLEQHSCDQTPLQNHAVHLIRLPSHGADYTERNELITNQGIVSTESLKGFYKNDPVIGDSLIPFRIIRSMGRQPKSDCF